jgi:diguanylate cyclase (GGDEF)-like protein
MTEGRILAIDDELFFRTLYEEILSAEGYYVRTAPGGEEGLELLKNEPFDLVITDMVMDGMDGMRTMEEIKRRYPRQGVVVVTSQAVLERAVEAMKLGALDYITKPINQEEFKLVISSLMERERLIKENVSLLHENLEQMHVIDALRRGQEIFLATDQERLFFSLLKFLTKLLGVSRSFLLLKKGDSDNLRVHSLMGLQEGETRNWNLRFGEEFIGKTIQKSSPLLIKAVKDREDIPLEQQAILGNSCIILPLDEEGVVYGAIILSDKASGGSFKQQDMSIASAVKTQASVAIKKARLVQTWEEVMSRDAAQGLYDYRFFQEYLEKETMRAQRYNSKFSVILVSIDNFESIHESHGDLAAVNSIFELGVLAKSLVRSSDIVAKLEGSEVAVIASETDYDGAIGVARRVKNMARNAMFLQESGTPLSLTVVVGIASFPEHGKTASTLMERARHALLKDQGDMRKLETVWELVDRMLLGPEQFLDLWQDLRESSPRSEDVDFRSLKELLSKTEFFENVKFFFNKKEMMGLTNFIEDECLRGKVGDAIIYMGVQKFSNIKNKIDKFYKIQEKGAKIYLLGEEDWSEWEPKGIIPLVTKDENIKRHFFLFCNGVKLSYGLIGRHWEEDDAYLGFFTSNSFLVEEIIKKIREMYMV